VSENKIQFSDDFLGDAEFAGLENAVVEISEKAIYGK